MTYITVEPINAMWLEWLSQDKSHPLQKGFGFLTLEDEFGLINVVVSPKMCEKFRIVFRTAAFVMVYGQRETRDGVVNIKATKINEIQL